MAQKRSQRRTDRSTVWQINTACKSLRITREDFLTAASANPHLLTTRMDVLRGRISFAAAALNNTVTSTTAWFLRDPSLFSMAPEDFQRRINRLRQGLRIAGQPVSTRRLSALLFDQPDLLKRRITAAAIGSALELLLAKYRPDLQVKAHLRPNISTGLNQLAAAFNVDPRRIIDAVHKHPSILKNPAGAIQRLRSTASLLAASEKDYFAAALRHPPLMSAEPHTVHDNIELAARSLSLPFPSVCRAALRHPRLFLLKPEKVLAISSFLREIAAALGDDRPLEEILFSQGVAFTFSRDRMQRYLQAAQAANPKPTMAQLFNIPCIRLPVIPG